MTVPAYFRKVIRISAEDSPNVRFARKELEAGKVPSNRIVVPGVLSYAELCHRLATWDPIRISVGIKAEWYMGAELILYPSEWLSLSAKMATGQNFHRKAKALGVDPAEGGDSTAFAAGDDKGLIDLVSLKTTDTTVIVTKTVELMRRHDIPPSRVVFDRGGGGKQHADRLRSMGYPVRTVGFGESISLDPKRSLESIANKMENREDKYAYGTRRVEMYWELSQLLDPVATEGNVFGIPSKFLRPEKGKEERHHLWHQMVAIPKLYKDGRAWLPPKNVNPGQEEADQKVRTLVQRVGHSPDELEALCLMLHGILHEKKPLVAGAR